MTHRGPLTDHARVWAAVLVAGAGACASHGTALWLAGAQDSPDPIHVMIPATRRITSPPGVTIHHQADVEARRHPAARPPQTRVEEAVLDVADATANVERVVGLVMSAVQRRLTTAHRIRIALATRSRHRWRALLREVLAEVDDGVASPLELRYARTVERAHSLPAGARNRPERGKGGVTRYRDVRYLFNLVVELDGREAHPPDQGFRDHRRDNAVVRSGDRVLRYGWRDVAGRPCTVAEEVGSVLAAGGWPGRAVRCGPRCGLRPST